MSDKEFSKEELLEHLEFALSYVMCEKLTGIDKFAMKSNVELFIKEEASRLSENELLEKFNTPEDSVNAFLRFLEQRGALEDIDPGSDTIH